MTEDNNNGKEKNRKNSRKPENEEDDNVRDLVQDFQSQNVFSQSSTSTPVQKKNKKRNNKTSTSGNKPIGVLPTVGSNKASKLQHVFRQEPGAGSSTDPLPVQIYEVEEDLQSGQEDTTGINLSTEDAQASAPTESSEARDMIQALMKQLITNCEVPASEMETALWDLKKGYIQLMRIRDKAQRNLNNIQYSRNQYGRIPKRMQIKIKPECPDNEAPAFQQSWAAALTTAENLLSDCMEKHLIQLIQNIDKRIFDLVNKTPETLTKLKCENPMEEIRNTLSKANTERARINEEFKKRKLENSKSKQEQPPNEKFKKNDNKKEEQ